MRKAAQLLVAFFLSAIIGVAFAALMGVRIGAVGGRPGAGRDARPAIAQQPGAAEQLRETQDAYLRILRDHPQDAAAMRGLIAIRRRQAGDDAAVLRRQASAYQQMAASGVESPEHYSRKAMELLASASLRAAAAVESEQRNAASGAPGAAGSQPPAGAFTPPALPAPPAQRDNVDVQAPIPAPLKAPVSPAQPSPLPAGRAGAASAPPPGAPSPAPVSPGTPPPAPQSGISLAPPPSTAPAAPASPLSAPPASTSPQQLAAGRSVPPPGTSEETIAVVPPPTAGPQLSPSEGSLARVDCQTKTFVLHGSNGDEEYAAAPYLTIYIRGVSSQRLPDFCGLQRHIGQAAQVWSVPDGGRRIVKSMTVVLPPQ